MPTLLHDDGDRTRTLATEVETADSRLAQARGLMFRGAPPEALVFRFDRALPRSVHMLFVRFPIDAVWIVDDRVERVKRLRSWTGLGWARADTLVELPAGGADGVDAGDRLTLVD